MVGKYAILEEVQVGGMGIVYKAQDTELDRIVALKIIKGGLLATTEEIARFRQEARAAARLDHPNIVPVHDIGGEEGRLYFTMAFAWGGSLARRLSCFIADPRAAAALVETVARAVHYAHEKGILHRDLKPGNILFDERGTPWVGDFGLAKFVDGSLELTRTGQALGTPAYMAPEQAHGHTDRISPRTDVWALGVLLYELLTGQRPFQGKSQEEQLHQVRTAEPSRPRTVNRSLDGALETVILKCLEKEPARRYASAEALADDLARWLRGEPVLARPPSWLVRAGRAVRRYRRPALRLGVTAVLLVLLWLAWRGSSPSGAPEKAPEAKAEEASEEKPPEEMEQMLGRLRKREKVTLIGASGPPLASRWQPCPLDARSGVEMDQFFRICAEKERSMLELLPAAPQRFRLRAQVRHCDSLPLNKQTGWVPEVGFYFAHGKQRIGEIVTHSFFQVTFNDRIPTAPRGLSQAHLAFAVGREKGAGFLSKWTYSCKVSQQFVPTGEMEPMPWRSLEVEVTPECIKTVWEGQPIKYRKRGADGVWEEADYCDPREILKRTASMLINVVLHPPNQPHAEPAIGEELNNKVSGGLGLYVDHGTAAFRFVEIEPLP
jgi:serine/threonine-protein kinase